MTPDYARALLAIRATQMCDVIANVAKTETDPIVLHRLAEVMAECEWCEKTFNSNKEDKTNV